MRIGIASDVHANAAGLAAALTRIAEIDADFVVIGHTTPRLSRGWGGCP